MTTRRIGYAGLNHHHTAPYLRTLETLPVDVVAACEPDDTFDPSSVTELGDVPIYDDVPTMLTSEEIDVLFLTLPNRDTPAAIETALDEDIDVFTEKPGARTADELEHLQSRVADGDNTVCVSYPWQSHPVTKELAGLVDEGFYGTVRAFDARFVASQLAFRDESHFIFDRDASGGGILQWLGIHWIQLFTWLLDDEIVRVNANTASNTASVDVEDGATLQVETRNGALGTLHCGYYLGEGLYDTQLDIYGDEGSSSWDPMGRQFGFDDETTLELDDTSGEWASTPHRTITHDYDPEQGYGGSWGRSFVQSFFAACDGNGDPPVTLADALAVLHIVDAAYESADDGGWITVDREDSTVERDPVGVGGYLD